LFLLFPDPFLTSTSSFLPSMVSILPYNALYLLLYSPIPTLFCIIPASMVSFLTFSALFLLFYRPFPTFRFTSPATASFQPSIALFLPCSCLLLTYS
jgi:hypothetical protein